MRETYKFYIAEEKTPLLIREATTEQLEAEVKRRNDDDRKRYTDMLAEYDKLENLQEEISERLDELGYEIDCLSPKFGD